MVGPFRPRSCAPYLPAASEMNAGPARPDKPDFPPTQTPASGAANRQSARSPRPASSSMACKQVIAFNLSNQVEKLATPTPQMSYLAIRERQRAVANWPAGKLAAAGEWQSRLLGNKR